MVSFAVHNVKCIKADPCGNWVTLDIDNGPIPAEVTLFFSDARLALAYAHAINSVQNAEQKAAA